MWKTLLIGGAAAAGKTTLAERIAIDRDAEVRSLDDMQRGEAERLLRRPELWDSPEEVLRLLRQVSVDFAPAVEELAGEALKSARRVVIEGESLRADTLSLLVHAHVPELACLFLVEDDAAAIHANLAAKNRNFLALSPERQANVVEVSSAYGQWLESEAKAYGLPVLRPRPWATLWDRAQLELGRAGINFSGS